MTADAQTFEIALLIRPTISNRLHMMNKRCHRRKAKPKTSLAKRMRRDVTVADFLPRTTISLVLIVPTGEMLIVPLHLLFVFLAVAALAVGQFWATLITAGAFGFPRHSTTSFWAIKNLRRDFSLGGLSTLF